MYRRYGVHFEMTRSIVMPGKEGAEKIAGILDGIRNNPPEKAGGRAVTKFTRFDTCEVTEGGKTVSFDSPKSDVFIFDFDDGARAVCRPSGTEPKIKFYYFWRDAEGQPNLDAVEKRYEEMKQEIETLEKEFLSSIGYEG